MCVRVRKNYGRCSSRSGNITNFFSSRLVEVHYLLGLLDFIESCLYWDFTFTSALEENLLALFRFV